MKNLSSDFMEDKINDCITIKFNAQSRMFFRSYRFNSIEKLLNSKIEEGSFCLLYLDNDIFELSLKDFFLCECIVYHSQKICITLIKRKGSFLNINFPKNKNFLFNNKLSLSLICTEDKLYVDFLINCINEYVEIFNSLSIDYEICVAFFGREVPDILKSKGVKYILIDKELFSMSFARNQSIKLCNKDHILITDLDSILKKDNLLETINYFNNTNHDGVLNIKNHTTRSYPSNSIYFASRDMLCINNYYEQFKMFWYEDTEYLMNFSRVDVVPHTFFTNFKWINHSRSLTSKYEHINYKLFKKIFKNGRQNE